MKKADQEQSNISEIFKILSNPVNLEIVMFLSISPTYPRELSRLLGRSETDVSRRLRKLEKLGLVKGEWIRVSGGTARIYRLTVSDIRLDLAKGRIVIDAKPIDANIGLSCGLPPEYGRCNARKRGGAQGDSYWLLEDPACMGAYWYWEDAPSFQVTRER